jgi:hypothetical protein
MSADSGLIEEPEVVEVIPDVTDGDYEKLKLDTPADRESFSKFIQNTNTITADHKQRLRRGLLFSGSDNPDRGTIMVVFRGSANFDDFNTDRVFTFRNKTFDSFRALGIEEDFTAQDLMSSARYKRNKQFIVEQMETYFNGVAVNGNNSYWDFYVTGHSLGGALSDTLSSDKLVHGGYSFSAPTDTPINNLMRADPNTGVRTRSATNAPTYRSINYKDRVIGSTDATTGGDAMYDLVIDGTTYNYNKPVNQQLAGHELDWFMNEREFTKFQVPRFKPGRLQRYVTGPQESLRRVGETVNENPIGQKVLNAVPAVRTIFGQTKPKPTMARLVSAAGRKRIKRGRGPPPSYGLALSLAKEAYSTSFDKAAYYNSTQDAILCPAPISCQEVKFFVCRWPRFNNTRERDKVIGNLVKIMSSTIPKGEPIPIVPAFQAPHDETVLEMDVPEDEVRIPIN